MSIYKQSLKLLEKRTILFFAFFTLFSFFPLISFGKHEIFPFYSIFAILSLWIYCNKRCAIDYFYIFLWLSSLFLLIYFFISSRSFLNLFQIYFVSVTLIAFNCLPLRYKEKFAKYIFNIIIFVTIFIIFQYFYPWLINFTSDHLIARKGVTFEILNDRVLGIAPEPSVMGSWLIGAWLIVQKRLPSKAFIFSIITVVALFFVRSLSAFCMFSVFYFILNYRHLKYILMFATFSLIIFLTKGHFLDRLLDLFSSFNFGAGINNLTLIDVKFGSNRLRTLVEPLTEIGCGELFCSESLRYDDGYSIFSNLFYKLAPLHLISLPLIFYYFKKDRFFFISLICFLAYAPMLNWMLFSGFSKKK